MEGSDASSGDSEPPRSRPPIDFSKDAEFRRRLPPVTNSPLVISPELLAASDAILAAHATRRCTLPAHRLCSQARGMRRRGSLLRQTRPLAPRMHRSCPRLRRVAIHSRPRLRRSPRVMRTTRTFFLTLPPHRPRPPRSRRSPPPWVFVAGLCATPRCRHCRERGTAGGERGGRRAAPARGGAGGGAVVAPTVSGPPILKGRDASRSRGLSPHDAGCRGGRETGKRWEGNRCHMNCVYDRPAGGDGSFLVRRLLFQHLAHILLCCRAESAEAASSNCIA